MDEMKIEKLLNIRTTGRDDTRSNTYYFPYEPTSYDVLRRLVQSGLLGKKNCFIDYGSGKGRVPFYVSYETGCKSIGVEYDERLYNKAMDNLSGFVKKSKVSFVCANAANYEINSDADRFFFFNPFSVEILESVVAKIIKMYFDSNCIKSFYLFFYYPSDEYIAYLMQEKCLSFYDEIVCQDLFSDSSEIVRERILIFEVG